jgi:hypothetical protein
MILHRLPVALKVVVGDLTETSALASSVAGNGFQTKDCVSPSLPRGISRLSAITVASRPFTPGFKLAGSVIPGE